MRRPCEGTPHRVSYYGSWWYSSLRFRPPQFLAGKPARNKAGKPFENQHDLVRGSVSTLYFANAVTFERYQGII
jgi:hypothetical protein